MLPEDNLMQPTRTVCPPQIEVIAITQTIVDVAKKIIAIRVHKLTRQDTSHHTLKLVQNGKHVPCFSSITEFVVHQPVYLVVAVHEYEASCRR